VLNVPLADGTYEKLEAKLEPARSDATTFNTANPNLVGKSVRIEGTYKGAAFVFTSSVRRSLEMSFNPPLVIDATTKNATVSFDAANPLIWAVATILLIGGFAVARITWRWVAHAWDDALSAARDKGIAA